MCGKPHLAHLEVLKEGAREREGGLGPVAPHTPQSVQPRKVLPGPAVCSMTLH